MSVQIRLGKDVDLSSHTEYEIQVHSSQGQFKFLRRYSALRAFHLALSKDVKSRLPPFPPKKVFGKMKPEFVSQRRKQLQEYFQQITNFTDVQQSEIFLTFIAAKDRRLQRSASEPLNPPDISPKSRRANSVEAEPKFLDNKLLGTIVEQAITAYINLAGKPAPIEARDAQQKQEEYSQLLRLTKISITWKPEPMNQAETADLPFSQVGFQRDWIIAEAADVSRLYKELELEPSQAVFKLSKPV
mmetsp:Transcript_25704/g.45058  ORF Transcript_25704/g.45058 Transcript_25704/m.45058 type:complete len:244 (+) Transcript_25704:3465-4196(+)